MFAAWLEEKEKAELFPIGVRTPSKALQGLILSTRNLTMWLEIWSDNVTAMMRLKTSQRPLAPPFQNQYTNKTKMSGQKWLTSVIKEKK